MVTQCNFEGCVTELPDRVGSASEKQLCIYCDVCLPKFLQILSENKKKDTESESKFEKESIERRREWLNNIEDVNYRDTMKKEFKYYKKPKYNGLFN